jgi:hypothetical protein
VIALALVLDASSIWIGFGLGAVTVLGLVLFALAAGRK